MSEIQENAVRLDSGKGQYFCFDVLDRLGRKAGDFQRDDCYCGLCSFEYDRAYMQVLVDAYGFSLS
jgi:hypothetical protein